MTVSTYLIISDEFYPYENASTNCLLKVLQQLVALGNDVTVLSCAYDKTIPPEEEYKGFKIKRIYSNNKLPYCYINFPFENERTHKKLFNFMLMLYGTVTKKIKYIKQYKNLKKRKTFDYIMSVHCPSKNHDLAYMITKKEDKWILWNLDPFVFNYQLLETMGYRKAKEKIWARKAHRVICAEGIIEENKRKNYKPFKNTPQLSLPLPNFNIDWSKYNKDSSENKIILRYTGAFYKEIRNPDYLIELLRDLEPTEFSVEFYGSCCSYLEQNYSKLPECFELKGTVSVDECHKLVETADILINIGNDCPNQIPSKTFEYIATGKPILNVYYSETDPSLSYLKRYPSILNLKYGQKIDSQTILNFINDSKCTEKKHLADLYSDISTENIVKRFCDFVET